MADTEEDRVIINKAKKIVMHKFKMSEMDAYIFIRRTAMNHKLKKVDVAKGIIEFNENKADVK